MLIVNRATILLCYCIAMDAHAYLNRIITQIHTRIHLHMHTYIHTPTRTVIALSRH